VSEVQFKPATDEVMLICSRCGAMVGDEGRHREWHAGLTELIRALEIMIMFSG
jgi:hypothetical protein